jgi:hypothetical protein
MSGSVMVQMLRPDDLRTARLKRFDALPSARSRGSGRQAEPLPTHVEEDACPTDAAALFQMGFDPEHVGRALTQSKGDLWQALKILRATKPTKLSTSESIEEEHEEEDADLALAIEMSLSQPSVAESSSLPASHAPKRAGDSSSSNPLWDPPRYAPAGGSDALRVIGGKTLSLVEAVQVRDGGYAWQPATAFLDTGNQHMTIVDTRYAELHAIHVRGEAERWTTLQGVVPGASSRAPCVTIALKVRGEEFIIQAAVSSMGGRHDLLLGVDVLGRLFASGFQIGAGSM